ncbi:MAG: type II toxin-antitoxin system death-on-curing family toxin [Actinomycetota bacterium]
MSKDFEYLTLADALAIHAILIKRYGGSDGVRDMGALESALFRPQTGYYDDVIAEAAALLESLAINHPFIDGNKRVAFAVTDVFLRINGHELTLSSAEIYKKFMELFDAGNFKYEYLEPWLRGIVQPNPDPN